MLVLVMSRIALPLGDKVPIPMDWELAKVHKAIKKKDKARRFIQVGFRSTKYTYRIRRALIKGKKYGDSAMDKNVTAW